MAGLMFSLEMAKIEDMSILCFATLLIHDSLSVSLSASLRFVVVLLVLRYQALHTDGSKPLFGDLFFGDCYTRIYLPSRSLDILQRPFSKLNVVFGGYCEYTVADIGWGERMAPSEARLGGVWRTRHPKR